MDKEERQLHHAAEAGRIFDKAVEPFQIMLAVELRRALRDARKDVHRAAKAHQQMTARRLAIFRHKELLLGRAEAHERHVRAARLDLRGDGGILLKIAVVRAGDDKAGKAVFEIFRRLLGNTRLRAEQVNALTEPGAALDHARAELDAGHAASERLVQNFRAVHDADAIRQHKVVRGEDGKYHFASTSFDANALNADPALGLSYIVAPPRMQRYLDVSTQIYKTYLKYVSPADIYPYSIDEVFIDVTGYLPYYHMSAHELAMTMVREVLYNTGITATAGIGTNLYLAKLAMDIVAKHIPADKDGVRIAELDEQSYRYLLWNHRPLTDFWMTGPGTVKRLEAHGIYTMGDLARFSIHGEDRLYEIFGVDAEILIDHAWGYEPCGMEQIKSYKPSTNSISEGQVLTCPYPNDKAKLIVREMAEILMFRLTEKKLVAESITLEVGYDRENVDKGGYRGLTQTDRYGRIIPKAAHGTVRFDAPTNLGSTLINESAKLFERITDPALTVRRITINANKVTPDEGIYQVDFFTDTKKLEKEKKLQQAMLGIKNKYGKNAVLKASSYEEGATMRQRNAQIGGHSAGGSDGKLQK